MRKRTKSRENALKILYQIEITKQKAEEAIEDFFSKKKDIPDKVRKYSENLVSGVIENKVYIDETITVYVENWDIKRIAIVDKNILRIAIYELLFCEDIPAKVAINEAVEIAKKYGDVDSGKFVNGILDRIYKEKNKHGLNIV